MDQGSYYFLFGYTNNKQALIRDWYQSYNKEGIIDELFISRLEQKLDEYDGSLEVYNNDQLIQTVGHEIDNQYNKLDVISRLHTPGKQSTGASVYIDETYLNNLFSRYYRGINTEKQAEGEGLGMSITKAIIDLHDGEINVHSERDIGTTITISLNKFSI